MVGRRGQCNIDNPSKALWKNPKYEHDRAVFLHKIRRKICQIFSNLYSQYDFLLEGDLLNEKEKIFFESITIDMGDAEATFALHQLSLYLSRYYGKKVIILLDEFEIPDRKQEVKSWYDGFTFGNKADIYNPWSILNYLNTRKLGAYWEPEDFHLRVAGSRQMSASGHLARCHCENSSSNSLVGKLIREGSPDIKQESGVSYWPAVT